MGRKEREYSHVTEAETMIKNLCDKYGSVLWQVTSKKVVVLGIENSERSEKNKVLAKIRPIKGVEKAVLQLNNINTQYVIELYWSDWHTWSANQKQWLIFNQLLHIHRDGGKVIKHDCEDFKIILNSVGVDWFGKKDNLPNMLIDKVDFNLDLRPGLEEYEDEIVEDVHEIVTESKKDTIEIEDDANPF